MTVRAALTGLYNSTRFTPFEVEVDVEEVVDEDLDRREGVIAMGDGIDIVVLLLLLLLLLLMSSFLVVIVASVVETTALVVIVVVVKDVALAGNAMLPLLLPPPLRYGEEGDSGTIVLLMLLSNAIDVGRSGILCRVGIIIIFCAQDVC